MVGVLCVEIVILLFDGGLCVVFIYLFRQKTAYEMRISDWSSDVCSSDLVVPTSLLKCRWIAVMAIYHFSTKVISRAAGSSALAAATYRSASRLHDERLDRHHDFSNKAGVVHSEVMLPDGAPEEWRDRERLWNDVEAAEVRKDAQLAREIEFAIPRELDQAEGIRLAREFVEREFVERGMVADLNVHWDDRKSTRLNSSH